MKGARMTIQDLRSSKVSGINPELFEKVEKLPAKKRSQSPSQPAPQVMWMWGQISWWSLHSGIEVKREFRFHPERKWRFDFVVPAYKIGIEYDGIMSAKSRHTTLTGFTGDTDKLNAAQALGWKVIRFTCKNYKTVLQEVEKLINAKEE